MKKPVDSLKVLAAAIALGVLVNTGCTPYLCNVESNKFNPITQLPDQFAVYATCMAKHGQIFG
jgi:hypothetical protein